MPPYIVVVYIFCYQESLHRKKVSRYSLCSHLYPNNKETEAVGLLGVKTKIFAYFETKSVNMRIICVATHGL